MNYRGQAKLYYLYMMSDGEVSDGEKKLFDKICKELYLDADDKKQVKQEGLIFVMLKGCMKYISKRACQKKNTCDKIS